MDVALQKSSARQRLRHSMDTIQKTAVQIIEAIETRLLGEHADGEATEGSLWYALYASLRSRAVGA